MPPTWSTCAWVRTSLRTGRPSLATAAANGSHCDRTMSVSITVRPSSSAITPALLTPDSPPGWSQTHTPSAISCSVLVGIAVTSRPYPAPTSASRASPRFVNPLQLVGVVPQRPVELAQDHVGGVETQRPRIGPRSGAVEHRRMRLRIVRIERERDEIEGGVAARRAVPVDDAGHAIAVGEDVERREVVVHRVGGRRVGARGAGRDRAQTVEQFRIVCAQCGVFAVSGATLRHARHHVLDPRRAARPVKVVEQLVHPQDLRHEGRRDFGHGLARQQLDQLVPEPGDGAVLQHRRHRTAPRPQRVRDRMRHGEVGDGRRLELEHRSPAAVRLHFVGAPTLADRHLRDERHPDHGGQPLRPPAELRRLGGGRRGHLAW